MDTPNDVPPANGNGTKRNDELPSLLETARLAHSLTIPEWETLNAPAVSEDPTTAVLMERILAIVLIRVLAIICFRARSTTIERNLKLPWFLDYSTSTICHTLLVKRSKEWEWPQSMTPEFMLQLKDYVFNIVHLYHNVPYHNFDHAYHVFISANKLLDLVLCEYEYPPLPNENENENNTTKNPNGKQVEGFTNESSVMRDRDGSSKNMESFSHYKKKPIRPTYGLKKDPLLHLAFLFSAFVHDVDHRGVTNRQLVLEGDELAIMYNDQSVAEQRSLAVTFSLFCKPKYNALMSLMVGSDENDQKNVESYMRFRSTVIDLVLCTDIASPERVQIIKSKWKEAFADKRGTAVGINNSKSATNLRMKVDDSVRVRNRLESVHEGQNTLKGEFFQSRGSIPMRNNLLRSLSEIQRKEYDSSISSSSGNETWENSELDCCKLPKISPSKKRKKINENEQNKPEPKSKDNGSTDLQQYKGINGKRPKYQKRFSAPGCFARGHRTKSFHFKLGIRRALDLDGAQIEAFRGSSEIEVIDPDQPNDLKKIVLLEQMIKAADISANLQCWETMIMCSHRLFKEQKAAFKAERGDDPAPGWFNNQIAFIESYTLPLTHRLAETGVFDDNDGKMFIQCVEQNRERWLSEGSRITHEMVAGGRHESFIRN